MQINIILTTVYRLDSKTLATLYLCSAIDSGVAGCARAPPEFGSSVKGQSLISTYQNLAITTNTPGLKSYLRPCLRYSPSLSGCYQAKIKRMEVNVAPLKWPINPVTPIHNRRNDSGTGKSLSEVLMFASINPQYDNGLFMKLP
jgi:hypothetical protein